MAVNDYVRKKPYTSRGLGVEHRTQQNTSALKIRFQLLKFPLLYLCEKDIIIMTDERLPKPLPV